MEADWPGRGPTTVLAAAFLLGAMPWVVRAEVTHDRTLGDPGGLSKVGDTYLIDHTAGELHGPNLFHSFGEFSIEETETAKFTSSSADVLSDVDNILGRVTGGSPSEIQGTLDALDYGHANVYLINPYGIIFGPGASLNVNGSFHASTADYIRLGEDGVFSAATNPNVSTLTMAPPSAFGFVSDNPAMISVAGSNLVVPEGETVSLVGGDIKVQGGKLQAPGGRINIASVSAPGEVIPRAEDLELSSA